MKKTKINIYQADFVFMLEKQAHEFGNCIIWKWGKIKKKKYKSKYGYIYRCEFKSVDDGIDCFGRPDASIPSTSSESSAP